MKKSSKSSLTPAAAKKPATSGLKTKAPVASPVTKTVAKPVLTTISARIDVGFGNMLYLRGEGPGLSWDKGVVMDCTGDDRWTLALGESARPVVFKFLLNDEIWSTGEDFSAKPGVHSAFVPVF